MTIQFNIDYRTTFGESLVLNIWESGSLTKYHMLTSDGVRWSQTVAVKTPKQSYSYYYSVMRDGKVSRCEWTVVMHRLDISAGRADTYVVYDRWQTMPEDAYLYSSAFTPPTAACCGAAFGVCPDCAPAGESTAAERW